MGEEDQFHARHGRVSELFLGNGERRRAVAGAYLTSYGLSEDSPSMQPEAGVSRFPPMKGNPDRALTLFSHQIFCDIQSSTGIAAMLLGDIITDGLDYKDLRKGQAYQIGGTAIEITGESYPSPEVFQRYGQRLVDEMVDMAFSSERPPEENPKWGRSGFHAHVVKEGVVRKGDAVVEIVPYAIEAE